MYGVCLELEVLDGEPIREGGTLVFFVANKDEITADDEDIVEISGDPVEWLADKQKAFACSCETTPLTHDSFIAYT